MRIMRVISAGFAIAFGLLVLLGYFIPLKILTDVRQVLMQLAVILAAVAVLVGVLNLLGVHWHKIRTRQKGMIYSMLLIVSLFASAVLGILLGTNNPTLDFFLQGIIIPTEAALMALLAVTLVYASARLLRRRVDLMTFIFLGVAAVILLVSAPLPFGKLPGADAVKWVITQFFAVAGTRGILIGVALGALTTGIRVLFGIDRPYGGN